MELWMLFGFCLYLVATTAKSSGAKTCHRGLRRQLCRRIISVEINVKLHVQIVHREESHYRFCKNSLSNVSARFSIFIYAAVRSVASFNDTDALHCIHICKNIFMGRSTPNRIRFIKFHHENYQEAKSPDSQFDENSDSEGQDSAFFDTQPGLKDQEISAEARRPSLVDPEVADQLEGNGWLDVIPGTPGKDYPNYDGIPETSFTCQGKTPGGYYADIEARCQVFHVCNTDGKKSSFICPSGSIFNQKYLVCDWWYDFECDDATDLYSLNEKVNRGGTGSGPSGPGRTTQEVIEPLNLQEGNFVAEGFELSLAGTGEGGPGYARNGKSRGFQSNVEEEEKNAGKLASGKEAEGRDGRKPAASSSPDKDRQFQAGENSRGNYRAGNAVEEPQRAAGNPHFRNGRHGEESNGFSENLNDVSYDNNQPRGSRLEERRVRQRNRKFGEKRLDRERNEDNDNPVDFDKEDQRGGENFEPASEFGLHKTEVVGQNIRQNYPRKNSSDRVRKPEGKNQQNDYLLGIVQDEGKTGNSQANYNQPRRYVPIL
ncbi:uncharacterized protein LOC124414488 [Diprion similis]|uniref:uncharacterized protein LOC124414488 n=1 Tax=Diprion similis TaxID=362088 RepID=UPI001EF9A3BF|nr:uncharacterized protein LOC124414488 [Diprion similis]